MTRLLSLKPRISIMALAMFLGACAWPGSETPRDVVQSSPTATAASAPMITPAPTSTATATPTPTPTPTFTPTPTPTLTPTPTPTPLPVTIHGDRRGIRLTTPSPQRGAPCGVVDLLDFPLDPPHGDGARIVQGFDTGHRGRLFHAGEDWLLASAPTLGAPVHSIGHGQVTYAAPKGWGADQGTVIVEHTFSDGRTILSFYGHLDPPSVVLNVGDCVARGDVVGAIGKPRSPPHLHFEIRSHTPTEPGPGYWPVDPVLAGWQPPSEVIWRNRMASVPGVQWVWSPSVQSSQSLGLLNGDTFVVIEDRDLVGLNVQDGTPRWRLPRSGRVDAALLDVPREVITVVNQQGQLEAYGLPTSIGGSASDVGQDAPRLLWAIDLEAIGIPVLMPLPDGGVMVNMWRQLFGLSSAGALLWALDYPASLGEWALTGDQLIFLATGLEANVWSVDAAGPSAWAVQIGGRLSVSSEGSYLYGQEGVYGLDPETRSACLHYALPRAYPGFVDVLELPAGGLLLAHADRHGRRLIALHSDGSLRWQRSIPDALPGLPHLELLQGRPYVLFRNDTRTSSHVGLFALDTDSAELTYIFSGGTSTPRAEDVAVCAIGDDRILINIQGAIIVALDAAVATEAALQATTP